MDNRQTIGFSFDARDTMKLNATPKFGNYGQVAVPQKSPFTARPSVQLASEISVNKGSSSVNTEQSPPATIHLEDQASWVDDLLDEPESPVNKSLHRRSRSDSVTYLNTDYRTRPNYYKELLHNSAYGNSISPSDQQHSIWTSFAPANDHRIQKDDIASKISGLSLSQQDHTLAFPKPGGLGESSTQITDHVGDENWHRAADVKRAKQHNARRSRVRKVQYIADLERSVQVLHAEGSLVSAELEFLEHQNMILNMENRALKQRLESLSQVQVIKSLEQEVLEREMLRLQYLYHQQNICLQQQPNYAMPRRVRSCNDFESQFPNHSFRPKEASSSNNGL